MDRGEAVQSFAGEVLYLRDHGDEPWVFWCMDSENIIGLSTLEDEDDLGFMVVI